MWTYDEAGIEYNHAHAVTYILASCDDVIYIQYDDAILPVSSFGIIMIRCGCHQLLPTFPKLGGLASTPAQNSPEHNKA